MKPGIYFEGKLIRNLTADDLKNASYFDTFLDYEDLPQIGLTVVLPVITKQDEENISCNYFDDCTAIKKLDMKNSCIVFNCVDCESLEEITLPKKMTEEDLDIDFVFTGTPNLKNIYIDKNNKNFTTEDGILYTKDQKKLIFCPALNEAHISDKVKEIGEFAFYDYKKEEMKIPYGVETLGEGVFSGNTFIVYLPDSLKKVSEKFGHYKGDPYRRTYYCSEKIRDILPEKIQKEVILLTLDNLLKKEDFSITEANSLLSLIDNNLER